MVREDIVGGLASALNRGQSLRQAMMSFYNAGYKKEDIEEAARFLQSGSTLQPVSAQPPAQPPAQKAQSPATQQKPIQPGTLPQKNLNQKTTPVAKQNVKPVPKTQPKPIQKQNVSAYGAPKKPRSRVAIFLLIALLVILFGALTTVFFFKEEIIAFFGSG